MLRDFFDFKQTLFRLLFPGSGSEIGDPGETSRPATLPESIKSTGICDHSWKCTDTSYYSLLISFFFGLARECDGPLHDMQTSHQND
jgi:hypothetical protein